MSGAGEGPSGGTAPAVCDRLGAWGWRRGLGRGQCCEGGKEGGQVRTRGLAGRVGGRDQSRQQRRWCVRGVGQGWAVSVACSVVGPRRVALLP
ncbi:hypothetical protein CesoFtcFv8_021428 [Champsocephalus esox]|uniref:Uncharacterized protein n=1 Tax=Champsocephalus esox TaxID=159716 RepID=A0AAN8BDU3_9TELE|nr:hypothetical protein CesoFtcFv8_021428 [Champsocephalus esox]